MSDIKNILAEKFPGCAVSEGKQFAEILVPASSLHDTAEKLKNDDSLRFDYLYCLTGIDNPEFLTIAYHLESVSTGKCIVMKVNTEGRENPAVDTVCDIWATAEFNEREIYDLLGVTFNNHPDMRRLLLDENWQGHPLRKDYKDEINIIER